MAINFPTNPTLNEVYTEGDRSWKWNGSAWDLNTSLLPVGPTGPTGATGPTGPMPTGSITGITAIETPDYIQFDTTPSVTPTGAGSIFWDNGNQSFSVNLNADVQLQLGQENVVLVYNNSASTITTGSVVAVNGAQGQRPAVVLADADSEALSAATLGVATQDIAAGQEGFVCTFGVVRGINTASFSAGAPVYLSQTAGQFTSTRPAAPAHTVFLGWIVKVNASSGELFVHISNGWELDELHNVLISGPTGGNLLVYNGTSSVWENTNTVSRETIFGKSLQETRVAIAASDIDLSAGNYFTKTISSTTTFTVSNVPASGTVAAFVLDLTNGGAATVNWFSGVKWAAATPPTLTASGRDCLAFFTHDGGTTWNGFVLGQAMA